VVIVENKPACSLAVVLMSVCSLILVNNQPDALVHVFIYSFHLSTCFEHHSAHHQEIELY
jgi:hypothetical protein